MNSMATRQNPIVRVLPSLTVVLVFVLLANPGATGKWKAEYDPKKYPSNALPLLRACEDCRIFADDEWGDYLIYQLYPKHRVFIDGRSDFYGQNFEQKYYDFLCLQYDWEQYLRQYRIDTVVLSTKSTLTRLIKASANWNAVYDTISIVFRVAGKDLSSQNIVDVHETAYLAALRGE